MDKEKVVKNYNTFKNYAYVYFKRNDIDMAVRLIKLTARIGYNYNFRYCDDDLESLISELSQFIIPIPIEFQVQTNRVVFFDSFGNSRVLALQYLRAIESLNFEVLYICTNKKIEPVIEDYLRGNPKSKILKLDPTANFIKNVIQGTDEICRFKPFAIFEHFEPWDVLGLCICNLIKSSKRYLINLTDHAFWLGKNSADYFLEFRRYGTYLSHFKREIPIEKLLFQPYYPLQAISTEFQGFPEEVNGKIILFSGSDFYKIFGDNGTFFKIVKRILEENQNVVFLLAGNGNYKPINSFIKHNKFEKRFILLGFRSDINEVIKRIDIYINTYPMIGGLMSQFAALNNKPIIGYTDESLYSYNDAEDLLQTKSKGILVRKTFDDFHSYLNILIYDESERIKNVKTTQDCIILPQNFANLLQQNLSNPIPLTLSFTNDVKINLKAVSNLYVDMEVNFLKLHYLYIWEELKLKSFQVDFFIGFISIIHKTKQFLYNKFRYKESKNN